MAQIEVPLQDFQRLPEEYDSAYMQDLIRALEVFIAQERTLGQIRGTAITLTNLPTSSSGLELEPCSTTAEQ